MNSNNLKAKLPEANSDQIFFYQLSPHSLKRHFCRLRIYQNARPTGYRSAYGTSFLDKSISAHQDNKQTVCLLTELANSGMSVTNSVEKIIPQVFAYFELKGFKLPENTIFVEHYGQESYSEKRNDPDSFDLVTIKNNKPVWQSISQTEFLKLINN